MEGGGGRSSRATAAAATKGKNKKKKDGPPPPSPRDVVPFDQVRGGISDALRGRLAVLGATAPSYLAEKTLKMSDVHKNQARLLFSCKGESLPLSPITACFTEKETSFVWDERGGLLVTALDRGGRSYSLICRYLVSNRGYRFIAEWKKLVEDNGLRRGMRVELWAFRSRQLPNRYVYEGEGKNNKVPIREEIGHPDGSLGLVVLDYNDDQCDAEHGDDEHDDDAALLPVQEKETGQMTAAEEKVAAGGGAVCAEPTTTTKDGMAASTERRMFLAAIGLIMLKNFHNGAPASTARENQEGKEHKPHF